MARRSKDEKYFACPHCGADVVVGADYCRECGASEESGWHEESHWLSIDVPAGYDEDDDFDYDEYLAREFPADAPRHHRVTAKRLLIGAIVIAICITLILTFCVGI